jgi:hypothetical protein
MAKQDLWAPLSRTTLIADLRRIVIPDPVAKKHRIVHSVVDGSRNKLANSRAIRGVSLQTRYSYTWNVSSVSFPLCKLRKQDLVAVHLIKNRYFKEAIWTWISVGSEFIGVCAAYFL